MKRLALFLLVTVAGALLLAGCNGGAEPPSNPPQVHTPDDGHDHGTAGHEGHDHGKAGHEGHDHGEAGHDEGSEGTPLGAVTVGEATLEATLTGEVKANAAVQVDLVHTAGPLPATVRLWLGEGSGVGSLKVKADGHDNHFHAEVEAPATIGDDTALWIEIQSEDGTRSSASAPLPR